MKGSAALWEHFSDDWRTPESVYRALDAEFRFGLDAAALAASAKCPNYLGPDHLEPRCRDALDVAWGGGAIWLNPPYSRCAEFVAKAHSEAARGATVVCLVPSRTDTRWWHAYVWDESLNAARPGVEIRFIRGRLKFLSSGGHVPAHSAPFPSAVVIFRPRH